MIAREYLLLMLWAATTGCSTIQETTFVTVPMQTPQRFVCRDSKEEQINYLLYLPKGYSSTQGKRWPLLLFLHGAGERGNDLTKVAVHGPPKIVGQQPDFPFILVSPQCPDDRIWSPDALIALVNEASQKYAVDPTRRYVTGLSMGGYGTWDLAVKYPEAFAAIAPICGGGEWISFLLAGDARTTALRSLGVWAFHGAKDEVVPVFESERMVEICKRVGIKDVQLTVYPDADHDSWTQTYENPELYEWLLKHQRGNR